jgi:RNA polymerase sigma-70 factor, ECF subfamily
VSGSGNGERSFRLVTTRANGQPAFGRYELDVETGVARAHGLTVLPLDGEKITQVASFVGAGLLSMFGLPPLIQ